MRKRANNVPANAIMICCDLCGGQFQFGPHAYNGSFVSAYQMSVCNICLSSHSDGISPLFEKLFEAHFQKHNLPRPKRNQRGWYPGPR
jgi:hypothetical protein